MIQSVQRMVKTGDNHGKQLALQPLERSTCCCTLQGRLPSEAPSPAVRNVRPTVADCDRQLALLKSQYIEAGILLTATKYALAA